MIKPVIYYELHCDTCKEIFRADDGFYAYECIEDVVEDARAKGWAIRHPYTDAICPECLEELSKKGRQ